MQTNNIHQIFNLNTESLFNEDEAYRLVNLLIPITAKAKNKINGLNSRLEYFKFQEAEAELIQNQINHEIQRWSEKVRRLGGFPLALYKVKHYNYHSLTFFCHIFLNIFNSFLF